MRILHFSPDNIFMSFVQRTFEEVFPGMSEYRVLGNPDGPLKFFKEGKNIRISGPDYWTSPIVRKDMNNCDCLLIHFMNSPFARAVAQAPVDLLVGWIGWGADYYPLIERYFGDLLLPETKKLWTGMTDDSAASGKKGLQKLKRFIRNPGLLHSKFRSVEKSKGDRHSHIRAIIPRLDFVWVNPEETHYFEKAFPKFNGRYHRICYYSAEEIFRVGCGRMNGRDILIGNSATPTNNHLELFEKLKKIDLGNRRLIAPLNYGIPRYADEVERIGVSVFGSRFVALRQFMPLDEYYEMIGCCGTILMNHIRQQAGTTIATGLYKGAKVYLRNENIVGNFYRNMGIRVLSLQDDFMSNSELFAPLSEQETQMNRQILEHYWGHEAALNDIRKLATMVNEKRALDTRLAYV